jgi:hypothetical protein
VYALDFHFAICVVITGCGAAQPMAAKPQVVSEAAAREDQLPMGVG